MQTAFFANSLFIVIAVWSSIASAKPQDIVLGMSAAFEGPAAQIGTQLKAGASLHFDQINNSGGIAGHHIKLLALDDGYEPYKTVENTKHFIETEKVKALFSYMGTPTSWAAKPLLEHSQIPFITPFTGADFLRAPSSFKVFNLRASYLQEASEQIKYLTEENDVSRIALLIQADEFGLTLEKSLVTTLKTKNMSPTIITRFRRNTQDINKALERIMQTDVQAVVMVGTYEPLARFINLANEKKAKYIYSTVSFSFSFALYESLAQPTQLMTTEVVPEPNSCKASLCREFIALTRKAKLPATRLSFEGYLNAYTTSTALKQCLPFFNQTCLITQLERVRTNDEKLSEIFGQQNQNEYAVFRSYYQ